MKNRVLLFALTAGLLLGCSKKKNSDHSIKAQVVEYGTHKPIAGAGILVHRFESGDGGWNSGSTIAYDSVVSDANGYFFIDGSEYRPHRLKLYTREANYYDERESSGRVEINERFIDKPVVELYPFAWAKLRFFKESEEIDYISTAPLQGEIFGFTIYTKDTIVMGRARGSDWNIITIYPYKNGEAFPVIHDSVFPIAHDTTFHEIRY